MLSSNAKESCPVFFGKATRLHHSFKDSAAVEGSEEKRLGAFRTVRDELRGYLKSFPASKFQGHSVAHAAELPRAPQESAALVA